MACVQGHTIEKVSKTLCVSHSTVKRVVLLYNTTGEVASHQEKHDQYKKSSESEELIVLEFIYLKEVQEKCSIFVANGSSAAPYAKQLARAKCHE